MSLFRLPSFTGGPGVSILDFRRLAARLFVPFLGLDGGGFWLALNTICWSERVRGLAVGGRSGDADLTGNSAIGG